MRKKAKSKFHKARSTETLYARALRSVAKEVGKIIDAYGPNVDPTKLPEMRETLAKYAEILTPWAKAKSAVMLEQVNRQDLRAWKSAASELSLGIREEIKTTPVGARMKELMDEQVTLIKSIPTKAAERVHKLVIENIETSGRHEAIAKEIARSGKVAASRATLIARTEVARSSSLLTQSRAEHIGSGGYIWRTVHDSDVRHSHRKLDGKYIPWDSPPTTDGLTYHAGQGPNCRCYPEPVIPEELLK